VVALSAATATTTLPRHDHLRAPLLAAARPEGYKEWQHFVIVGPTAHLLVNFSLTSQVAADGRPRLVPRVIVVGHTGRWSGTVERVAAEPVIAPDLASLAVAGNHVTVRPDGYEVLVDLPSQGVAGALHLAAGARPAVVVVPNQPVGDGRLNWLFVPRLRATGWLRLGGREHRFDDAVAYHDHNWGRFRWGADFGWIWGTVLPRHPADPWSAVFMAMTDRRRLRCRSQALYVWRHDEPMGFFRDTALHVTSGGRFDGPADCTLPPVTRLLLGGATSRVPASLTVDTARARDQLRLGYRPTAMAHLVHPSEVRPDQTVVLAETIGPAHLTGSVDGERIDVTGPGVFEWLDG
jgi:hypothetical protein